MAKEVTKAETSAVAPAAAFDMSRFETTNTGFENVRASDLLVPRLTILQPLSPQCTEGKPEYKEEYRPGMIFDTGLSEQFGKKLSFLPVHFAVQWLVWAPRETGKGLIDIKDNASIMDQTEKDLNGRDVLPDGNYVVETGQIYGLNLSAKMRPSYIGFTSTQLKKSRRWLTLATSEEIETPKGFFQAPFWYRAYDLATALESNAKGSWHGWLIERGQSIPEMADVDKVLADRMWDKATSFRKSIEAGEVKADLSAMDESGGNAEGSSRRGQADTGQEM